MKTLSFAEALHPEVVVDDGSVDYDRGLPSWERFWREARGELPVAIAERIDDNSSSNDNNFPDSTSNSIDHHKMETGEATKIEASETPGHGLNSDAEEGGQQRSPKVEGCFYLEGLIGSVFALSVVLGVFVVELVGAIVYLLAVGFFKLAKQPNVPVFFQAIFQLLTQIFMVLDAVFLLSSVLISEILGFVVGMVLFIICLFTGDAHKRAYEWMLYVRTVSHLMRQTFRTFHHGWEPQRKFPLGQEVEDNNKVEENIVTRPNNDPDGARKGRHNVADCEPTVIETSATFVIETLDDDLVEGDDEDLKKVSSQKGKPGSGSSSRSSSSSSSRSSSGDSSASIPPPPPPPDDAFSSPHRPSTSVALVRTGQADGEGRVGGVTGDGSLPISYVMTDDEDDDVDSMV